MPGRLGLLVALLVLATVGGLIWQRRSGRFRQSPSVSPAAGAALGAAPGTAARPDVRDDRVLITAESIGAPLGERATLVQFSSAFCAPCRAARVVLADVASIVPGVRHVEVDAESHLDLVRELKVLSTPTIFVLDATGAVTSRAAGLPKRQFVLAALADAVGDPVDG